MAANRPDLRLVQAALAGDPEAREQLARRLACIRRILGSLAFSRGVRASESELDDLAQDTFTRIWNKLATYRGDATLETWAYTFCDLQFMNFRRKHNRKPKALDDVSEELVAPEREVADVGVEMTQLLKHLTEREAEIVSLRFGKDMKLDEIAALLEVSSSTVKTCYYRALTKLRPIMESHRRGEER